MVVVYSATEGLAAMTLAIAHSRGWLDCEERVCTYWPEFAQKRKDSQKPAWEPGTRQPYHAITLGLYESELLRQLIRSIAAWDSSSRTRSPHPSGWISTSACRNRSRIRGWPKSSDPV